MPSNPPSFGFVCVIADEGAEQLKFFLGHFRAAYPDAPLVVISDGVDDASYAPLCTAADAKYEPGRYLKRLECGGLWWERTLRAGLALGTDYVCKVDPDTKFHRPFRGTPPGDVCGTVSHYKGGAFVQGGCQVIRAAAAARVLQSGLLGSAELASRHTYATDDADSRQIHALAYLSTDRSLAWLARRLGLWAAQWDEVGSVWRPPAPPNGDLYYAVTHPHKVGASAPAGDEPLHVITTCKGRLAHLKRTLPAWTSEPGVTATVVDYDCPDGTTSWVTANHPSVRVVEARGLPLFNLSRARNLGAAHAPGGWLCFFDADWECKPGWAASVRSVLRPGYYFLSGPTISWGQFGSVVVHSSDFRRAGGYDELFRAWGWEDGDFYARLRHSGARPGSMPGSSFASIEHGDEMRTAFYGTKQRHLSNRFYNLYVARKTRHMIEHGRPPTTGENRRFLIDAASAFDDGYGDPVPHHLVYPPGEPSPVVTVHEPHAVPGHAPVTPGANPLNPVSPVIAGAPASRPRIVIVNRSSVVADSQGKAWTAALQVQLDRDVAPLWFGRSADLSYCDKNTQPPLSAWHLYLLDDSDVAGALGYHDRTAADQPFGNVFCKTTQQDGGLVSVTVSHELLEMLMDPHCNQLADASPDGSGSLIAAYEVADAPEDDRYAYAIDGVPVSDFVTPAYFDPAETTGPFDHQGHISKPFEILPGGYLAFLEPGKGWTQKTADGAPHHSSQARYRGNRWHRRKAGRAAAGRNHGHAQRTDAGLRSV